MEALNHALFLSLNAPENPSAWTMALAIFLAEHLIWVLPLLLVTGWLRGSENIRRAMLAAALAAGLGLLLNQLIGLAWANPRPFVIGLGRTLIPHAADPSFPSDHLTLWWGTAFGLLLQSRLRGLGAVLALLGLPVAWARIYLGVHYPLDMLGAHLPGRALPAGHAGRAGRGLVQRLADMARRGLVHAAAVRRGLPPAPGLVQRPDRPGLAARVSDTGAS